MQPLLEAERLLAIQESALEVAENVSAAAMTDRDVADANLAATQATLRPLEAAVERACASAPLQHAMMHASPSPDSKR